MKKREGIIFIPICHLHNLGQKVGDKFTKLSRIGFSVECFAADFLRFFTEKHQNLASGWMAGYSPSNLGISGILLKFPGFLRSLVLTCEATREATKILQHFHTDMVLNSHQLSSHHFRRNDQQIELATSALPTFASENKDQFE